MYKVSGKVLQKEISQPWTGVSPQDRSSSEGPWLCSRKNSKYLVIISFSQGIGEVMYFLEKKIIGNPAIPLVSLLQIKEILNLIAFVKKKKSNTYLHAC